jgi:hypothetical protein
MHVLLTLLLFAHSPQMGTRGTVEATVVTPATMNDHGKVSGQQPTQKVVVKNPDGSVTIRADY